MTRARDLADSADKDIAGTLTVDVLGVGTSSPAADLHVNSGASNLAGLFESTDEGATITLIDNGTTGGSAAEHGLNTVGNQLEIRAVDNISFETGGAGSEAMRISSGNVGIGTSSPNAVLSLGTTSPQITFIDSANTSAYSRILGTDSGSLYISADEGNVGSNTNIIFEVDTSEAMRIDSSGNVGIGTSSPQALLDVAYNLPDDTNGIIRPLRLRTTDLANETNLLAGDGVGILFEIPDQSSGSVGASIDAVKESGTDADISTSLSFKTSANNETLNEAMRLDASGNLLVGRTTLSGTDNSSGSYIFNEGAFVAQRSSNVSLYLNRYGTDGDIALFRKDGTTVGSISITSSGTTYNTTSDLRLKDNIEPIADATEKLMSMKPVTHTWIADPDADAVFGFIAQEMQEIVPEAVSGDPDGEEMMSMDYGRITPVLVAALQEATNEIKALKQRVSELEEHL
jgi:hypothetical protein